MNCRQRHLPDPCVGCIDEGTIQITSDQGPMPPSPNYVPGQILLWTSVAVFLLLDFWLLHYLLHLPTTSQGTQHWAKRFLWVPILGAVVFGVLWWHLFRGFPW